VPAQLRWRIPINAASARAISPSSVSSSPDSAKPTVIVAPGDASARPVRIWAKRSPAPLTVVGERILLADSALAAIAPIARSHHERWDGTGYPDRLEGEAIPAAARIVAVCDAYEAMVADRPYHAGRPQAEALAELERCAGSHFEPAVVEAFVAMMLDVGGAGDLTLVGAAPDGGAGQ
jgi:hypothetical protein